MMSPVRPVRNAAARRVRSAFEEQGGAEWGFIGSAGPQSSEADTEFHWELVVLPKGEEGEKHIAYSPDSSLCVVRAFTLLRESLRTPG